MNNMSSHQSEDGNDPIQILGPQMSLVLHSPNSDAANLAATGINHANTLLRNIQDRNPECLTHSIEAGAFAAWLYEDNPGFEKALTQTGSLAYFERRLGRYLSFVPDLRKIFRALEWHAGHSQPVKPENLPATMRLRLALATLLPSWNNAALDDVLADVALLTQMFPQYHHIQLDPSKVRPTPTRYRLPNLTPALELIHEQAESNPDSCFLIDASELPDSIRTLVAERHCVVIPVACAFDESWIFNSAPDNMNFHPLVFTDAPSFNDVQMMLSVQREVMFDYDALTESLFRKFRAELPVVYVSRSSGALVTYPFLPFWVDDSFHRARYELDMGGCFDSSESFENFTRSFDRNNLPRHTYVVRTVLSLTGACTKPVTWPILPHWMRDDIR
ncbi:hypothetical protein [Paraburkholderia azotifigens]|uniref:Uncharacterized protein n=1 Tax=Paraburkholderia azotifigens TaxID=2057004 RepID=A0A5C6V686_9BURK|nr:hypothetical protein [Paraburkholderia azotifigens]TXC80597.1 hypothetical protein FRZ40_40790 [Paraburkholderia azotifigens]